MKLVNAVTDLVAAPMFRTDEQGRRVFAPSSISSERFLISDPAAEARLRTRMAFLMGISVAISITLIVATIMAFGWPREWTMYVWLGVAAAFALQLAANISLGKGLAAGLPKTETAAPIGFVGAMVDQARAWPRWLCWLELLVGPLVLSGGILSMRQASSTYDLTLSVTSVLLSFLMIGFGLAGLVGRRQSSRQ